MTPAEKLRQIVQDAKGDDLERAIESGYDKPGTILHGDFRWYESERAEWQAASDLLERLLKQDGK